jgi:hypothetical protein
MYRGFKLESISITDASLRGELIKIGEQLHFENKQVCEKGLKEFLSANNSLDGTQIVNTWFPQVKADIFISHSHADTEMAKILSGIFYKYLKLRSFIDSCVWGYAEDLLKIIDNRYCKNDDGKTYDYHKRNFSTSHVHMMLATALSMMIDKVECLLFLNTPNSITPTVSIDKTQSPWLYYEIGISQTVRKEIPERILNEGERLFSRKQLMEKALQIEYEVDLNHLNEIDFDILKRWVNTKGIESPEEALDALYKLCPEKRYSNSLHG